jgi:hypothetical protein
MKKGWPWSTVIVANTHRSSKDTARVKKGDRFILKKKREQICFQGNDGYFLWRPAEMFRNLNLIYSERK